MFKDFINFIYQITGGAVADNNIKMLENKLSEERAWALFWIIRYTINLAVYFRDSIGRMATYCNIASYDLFDRRSRGIWNVSVQIGASLKENFAMGNEVTALNYDISPIMPKRDINKILGAPIPAVYKNAIEAAKKGEIKELSPEEAQEKANKGTPSMIIHPGLGKKNIGHVAIVAPNFQFDPNMQDWALENYNPAKGVFTGNAGWTNDMMYETDKRGFGAFWGQYIKDRKIFEFRNAETGEFDNY